MADHCRTSPRPATSTPTTWSGRFERQVDADASVGDLRRWRELPVHRRRPASRPLSRASRRSTTTPSSSPSTPPNSTVFVNFPMDFLSIGSAEYADQLEAAGNMGQFNTMPVGTGPFQYVDYQADTVIRYAAQPGLLEGQGEDRRPDLRDHRRARRRAWRPSRPASATSSRTRSRATSKRSARTPTSSSPRPPGLNVGFIAYNTQQAPFDKPEVRQALNMAVNKEAILEGVYSGQAVLAINPIPPSVVGVAIPMARSASYDPEKAKEMLAAAGVDRSLDEALVDAGCAPLQPERQAYGRTAAGRLERHRRQRRARQHGLAGLPRAVVGGRSRRCRDDRLGCRQRAIPDNFLGVLLGCAAVGTNNRAQWCNEPYDDLIQQAKATFDQAERTDALHPGRGDLPRAGPVAAARPLEPVRRVQQARPELQPGSARLPPLRRRRHRRVS